MRTHLRSLTTALGLTVFAAVSLHAQNGMIQGKVLSDDAMNLPVAEATVRLLDAAGYELDYVGKTNAAGTFTMRVPPGRYMLQLRRIGVEPARGPAFTVQEGEIYKVTLRATSLAMRLADEKVVALPNVERGRDGMAARCSAEGAICLNRQAVEASDLGYFPSLFMNVRGMQVNARGEIKSLEGNRCLVFMVNRLPVKSFPFERPIDVLQITLEELIPTSHEVMGIEVYKSFKDVPKEFRMQAWPQEANITRGPRTQDGKATGSIFEGNASCGLINVWTIAAW